MTNAIKKGAMRDRGENRPTVWPEEISEAEIIEQR